MEFKVVRESLESERARETVELKTVLRESEEVRKNLEVERTKCAKLEKQIETCAREWREKSENYEAKLTCAPFLLLFYF